MIITSFSGKNSFLSNFAEINIIINGKLWKTSEHMYMACKTEYTNEIEIIRLLDTPGKAKRYSKTLKLRPKWESIKDEMMLSCLRHKFSKNFKMRDKLLATTDAILIEGNTWHDNYWGKCSCKICQNNGNNMLGILLMQVRQELKSNKLRIITTTPENMDW